MLLLHIGILVISRRYSTMCVQRYLSKVVTLCHASRKCDSLILPDEEPLSINTIDSDGFLNGVITSTTCITSSLNLPHSLIEFCFSIICPQRRSGENHHQDNNDSGCVDTRHRRLYQLLRKQRLRAYLLPRRNSRFIFNYYTDSFNDKLLRGHSWIFRVVYVPHNLCFGKR